MGNTEYKKKQTVQQHDFTSIKKKVWQIASEKENILQSQSVVQKSLVSQSKKIK